MHGVAESRAHDFHTRSQFDLHHLFRYDFEGTEYMKFYGTAFRKAAELVGLGDRGSWAIVDRLEYPGVASCTWSSPT
jgi:hypothetical protein